MFRHLLCLQKIPGLILSVLVLRPWANAIFIELLCGLIQPKAELDWKSVGGLQKFGSLQKFVGRNDY